MVDILESKVVGTNKETWYKLVGTSEDTKPIGEFPAGTGHTVAKNSTFFEIGTQIKYEFDGSAWAPKGQVDIKLVEKTITENGTYNPADDDADGYSEVTVNTANKNNAKFDFYSNPSTQFAVHRSLTTALVPEGYTSIQSQAFRTYTRLVSVTIPNTVESIGSDAFLECKSLETITINKPEGSIADAPWGAPDTCQVIWTG